MLRMRRKVVLGLLTVAILVLVVAVVLTARSYARAASLVVRSAGQSRLHPTIAAWDTEPFSERAIDIPTRYGPLRAWLYTPGHPEGRAIVLTPGVNALGIDEPRLKTFARALAATGLTIVTPGPPDLARYQVTTRSTDEIEDAAAWMIGHRDLTGGRRIGVMGISFAGALSIVAAGRPSIRDRLAFVFSFGGYADFPRVRRYLCSGVEALPASSDGAHVVPPHDYGVAIILLDLANRLVPPGQVEPLQNAILTFLHASHLALFDQKQAEETFARARALVRALPEPAATLMHYVNDRAVNKLGPLLLPYVVEMGRAPALSPDRSPAPTAPVFLLHGTDDNVIPSAETLWLAEYLRPKTDVHVLLSSLISHADVDRAATWSEQWKLVRFWKEMLDE